MRIGRTHLLLLVSLCCLVAVTVGLLNNVQGLFLSPIAVEIGASRGAVSMTITLGSLSGGFGGMLVPRLMRRRHLRMATCLLVALCSLATAGLSCCQSMASVYALCVIRGLAAGTLGFVFVTSVLNAWFSSHIGLLTSLAMGCSGIAGSVFSLVFSDVIEAWGWRAGYLVMAGLALVLMTPAVLFVPAARPEDIRLSPYGGPARQAPDAQPSAAGPATEEPPVPAAVLALVVAFSLLVIGPASMSQHLPSLALGYGLGQGVGATMLSASMVTNTAGKVAFGALSDKVGARRSILMFAGVVSVSLVGLLLSRGTGTLVGSAALFGLTFSLNTVGVSALTRELCGSTGYERIYPLATLVASASYAALCVANGYMYDATGGYALSLALMLAFLLAAVGASLLAYARVARAKAA